MKTIQPRNPILGLARLLALGWTLLSVLGLGLGGLAALYAGAWGCVGHHLGWFGCTIAWAMLPLWAATSLVVAMTVLFFSHVFYVAGARQVYLEARPKRSWKHRAGGFVLDIIADLVD